MVPSADETVMKDKHGSYIRRRKNKTDKGKEHRLGKKGGREGGRCQKIQKMYVYISHILVSSTQKMLGNVISK